MNKRFLEKIKGETHWAFAIINGKLAEMHFVKGKGEKGIFGYCYVDRKSYKTKMEQKMIDADIKNNRFSYRKKKYRLIIK
jgi:hypothetical protein